MGLTKVTATITNLAKTIAGFESLFLVDTGAIHCLAPKDELHKAGVSIEGKATYELANGQPYEVEYGFEPTSTRKIELPLAVLRLMESYSFSSELAELIASLAGLGNQGGPPMSDYPNTPGFKSGGPSSEAADTISASAKNLRAAVLRTLILTTHGMSADEIASELKRSILSVRPRVSELHRLGVIRPSGERSRNESGMSATVWTVSQAVTA